MLAEPSVRHRTKRQRTRLRSNDSAEGVGPEPSR